MNTYYVTVDTQGYIDSWSDIEFSHSTEIQSDESLVGKLGYVKVIEGVASVDTDKEQELIHESEITHPISIEELQKENSKLQEDLIDTQLAVSEVFEMLEGLL